MYKRKIIEPLYKSKDKPGQIETQHIIPKCCNGPNEAWNKVNLTTREHFVAHWLLTKIYSGTKYEEKIYRAFFMMSNRCHKAGIKFNSKSYALLRQKIGYYMHTNNPLKDKASRQKLSKSKKGSIPWNKNKKNCMPEPWNKGLKMSDEFKNKISEANIKRFKDPNELNKLRKKHKQMSASSRKNMSAARSGTRFINNGITQTRIKPLPDGTIPEPYKSLGYKFGYIKRHTDETKQRIRNKLLGIKRTDEQKENYRKSKLGELNPMYKKELHQ